MAAKSKDTPSMVAVIPKFLDALPSIFKNMPTSLLLVLQHFSGILSTIIFCCLQSSFSYIRKSSINIGKRSKYLFFLNTSSISHVNFIFKIMDIQLLFGHLFNGVLSLGKSWINSFEHPLELVYHWNAFALIITSIFPPQQGTDG